MSFLWSPLVSAEELQWVLDVSSLISNPLYISSGDFNKHLYIAHLFNLNFLFFLHVWHLVSLHVWHLVSLH